MLVLHGNWSDGALHLWAESLTAWSSNRLPLVALGSGGGGHAVATAPPQLLRDESQVLAHPFTLGSFELRGVITELFHGRSSWIGDAETMTIMLPCDARGPQPSDRLASAAGEFEDEVWEHDHPARLNRVSVETVTLNREHAVAALLRLSPLAGRRETDGGSDDAPDEAATARRSSGTTGDEDDVECGQSLRYWVEVAHFIAETLEQQRFIPALVHPRGDGLQGAWQPWLHDADASRRAGLLLAAMPPVARAAHDELRHHPWAILNDALRSLTDATVREHLIADEFAQAIEGRSDAADSHVAWLGGLLGPASTVAPARGLSETDLLRQASQWIGRLDDTGQDQPLRLCLTLHEPELAGDAGDSLIDASALMWRLSFALISSADQQQRVFAAEQLWNPASSNLPIAGERLRAAQERLLTELSRAARMFAPLETALQAAAPVDLALDTAAAYRFLRETKPILEEAGVDVRAPHWWSRAEGRIGLRLHVDSPQLPAMPRSESTGASASGRSLLGLASLVQFRWHVAVGEQTLTLEEFQSLAAATAPLARVRGQWVEVDAGDLAVASQHLAEAAAGEMTLLEAIRLTSSARSESVGLPVFGLDATGWVRDLLEASHEPQRMPSIEQPRGFQGELRPYQKTGLSWLAFLDRFGLGACLADDMGLGKTIQLIALLLHERESASPNERVGPTLLIVPTSVIGNWARELERFAPSLRHHMHHGPDRPLGEALKAIVDSCDVVITTYALVNRDQNSLGAIAWRRVVLDEAQYIKNPPTKQAQAIRSFPTHRRLALTGTPVENRLSELWSIMEFCNPGYLGPAAEFRRSFSLPIERHRDKAQSSRLRDIVRPFILRRLKTDRSVINDLPPCVETREYATLTAEQASLYEQTVGSMLGEVDRAEGLQRRGLVLATLVKLKQICNHPALLAAHDRSEGPAAAHDRPQHARGVSHRSGKCRRILTMLEEILAVREHALIFTQFRQMGHLLAAMIQHDLEVEPLFLHGGTPQKKRQEMIDRFQDAAGDTPVFILSLKAGGLGLNLTAANHVFHFDRWWNPAVENQATDRAFRIGQTRTVHVHKFVCMGTLEERIDQMIEQKTELAQNIIGAGEQWLTELSTRQLHDLLTLRPGAIEGDGE